MADQNLDAGSAAQAGAPLTAQAVPSAAPSDAAPSVPVIASSLDPSSPLGAPSAPPAESFVSAGGVPAASDLAPSDLSAEDALLLRTRLLDIARVDSDNAARLVQSRHDFARRGELLMKAIPDKYLEIVGALRLAVRTYNDALRQQPENPIPHCQWYESPNVTLREPLLGDGMRVRLSRLHCHFELVLRFVNRSMKPDVPLIEGYGDFGRDMVKRRVLLRIEGWVERGEVQYWYNLDFKRQQIPLHEIPDRIVMAVVASDYTHLSRDYKAEDARFDQDSGPDAAT